MPFTQGIKMITSLEQAVQVQQKRMAAGKTGFSKPVLAFLRRDVGDLPFFRVNGLQGRGYFHYSVNQEAKDKLPYLPEGEKYEIKIAQDGSDESVQVVAWMNNRGHKARLTRTIHDFVDGKSTITNDWAYGIICGLLDEFRNEAADAKIARGEEARKK